MDRTAQNSDSRMAELRMALESFRIQNGESPSIGSSQSLQTEEPIPALIRSEHGQRSMRRPAPRMMSMERTRLKVPRLDIYTMSWCLGWHQPRACLQIIYGSRRMRRTARQTVGSAMDNCAARCFTTPA